MVIEILDMQGRVLQRWPGNGQHQVSLDVRELSYGVHLVRTTFRGAVFVQRVVIY